MNSFPAKFWPIFFFVKLFTLCLSQSENATFLVSRQRLSSAEANTTTDPLLSLCKNSGVFPVANSCSDYVACRGTGGAEMVVEHYRCPEGLRFSPGSKKCSLSDVSAPCLQDILPVSTLRSTSSPQKPTTARRRHVSLNDKPASYVSELTGLTCRSSGFFPHPTNSTKFYRCVALHLNSTFMVRN